MKQSIIDYYSSEDNSYTMPGKRDYVQTTVGGRKVLIQKKLLFYTVHDLFLKFVEEYQGNENLPSFSYFASLKPIECIHAGDPGSHSICTCAEHQNVKLKLHALTRKIKYRDLIQHAVCSVDNVNCMLKRCEKCPGKVGVLKALNEMLEMNDITLKERIEYKSWVDEGSRASLQTLENETEKFKIELSEDIHKLTVHHYVADEQSRYLKYCKDNLQPDTCIILMDFSENYSFIIQESVQAFYYNNDQATIHPFCMYYKQENNEKLLNQNFCVISDTKDHFAYTVNAFTEKLISEIVKDYGWIKNIIYFSDGAPQQYKNK